ncbi:hypothetical protein BBJ28_00026274, partial [Nothophytophthora sp. Chile5]
DVTDDMTIAREEIFGPVMSILKFKTVDEVIERANDSNYGLGAGVVTQNIDNAIKISNGLRAGTVYVNCYDVFDSNTPFGGYKDSGIGRENGQAGLHNYLENKTVIIKLCKSGLHLGGSTLTMGHVVRLQGKEFDNTDGLLGGTMKRLGAMMEQGGSKHMLYLIVFVVVVFVLLYFAIRSH